MTSIRKTIKMAKRKNGLKELKMSISFKTEQRWSPTKKRVWRQAVANFFQKYFINVQM